jgi:hypothetical protein
MEKIQKGSSSNNLKQTRGLGFITEQRGAWTGFKHRSDVKVTNSLKLSPRDNS